MEKEKLLKKFDNIDDIVKFMLIKHKSVTLQKFGFIGYKLLRKPSGRRIVFEEIKGFRILKHSVFDNDLIIQSMASGLSFRKETKMVVESTLFLTDLALINVYDNRSEFFSNSSIDFSYIMNDYSSGITVTSEWLNNKVGELRGQWIAKNSIIEEILKEPTKEFEHKCRFLDIGEDHE